MQHPVDGVASRTYNFTQEKADTRMKKRGFLVSPITVNMRSLSFFRAHVVANGRRHKRKKKFDGMAAS